jgi:LacI family transcriptional regulator
VVILDEDVEGARGPKIFCDNEQGGYLAGRCLAEAGHRRVAFLGGPEHMMSTGARLAGCRRALAEATDGEISTPLFGDYSVEHGRRAAEELIRRKDDATAVFVTSDEIAIGALEVFAREGVSIPQQLSVIGFDDVAPFHLFNPPLTCVRQPVEEMGRRAVELLVSGMVGASMRTTVERLPVELILRGSVASPARTTGRNRPHREGRRHVQ